MKQKLSEIVLPAYYGFWRSEHKIIALKGSRGSGKSYQTALKMVKNVMAHPEANGLVVRSVERTLKDSCYSDLKRAMFKLGVLDWWHCTKSPLEMVYKPTGQQILFRGFDDPLKIASISVPKGVLNMVWIEEAYQLGDESDFDMIDESIRGIMPEGLSKQIILTFNPWSDKHWLKRRFFDTPDDDVLCMTTTYKDNPFLSEDDYRNFEKMKKRNPRRYQVAGLGNWGITEGLIYENWQEDKNINVNILLKNGCLPKFGLDFGFTNPTAMACSLLDRKRKIIYVYDEIYKTGLTNEERATIIKDKGYSKANIIADSESPESIAELNSKGLNVTPARKGKDSVRNGIEHLQNYEIHIDPKCENFLNEIANYSWKKDKLGNTLEEPVKEGDHLMDAFRYSYEDEILGDDWLY